MTDIFSQEKRSEIMSKVKSRNTKPDILIRVFSSFILNFKDNLFRLSFIFDYFFAGSTSPTAF